MKATEQMPEDVKDALALAFQLGNSRRRLPSSADGRALKDGAGAINRYIADLQSRTLPAGEGEWQRDLYLIALLRAEYVLDNTVDGDFARTIARAHNIIDHALAATASSSPSGTQTPEQPKGADKWSDTTRSATAFSASPTTEAGASSLGGKPSSTTSAASPNSGTGWSVEQEREACAKIIEEHATEFHGVAAMYGDVDGPTAACDAAAQLGASATVAIRSRVTPTSETEKGGDATERAEGISGSTKQYATSPRPSEGGGQQGKRPALPSIPDSFVRDYLDGYEFRFDDGSAHEPDDNERALLEDFGEGLIAALRSCVTPTSEGGGK